MTFAGIGLEVVTCADNELITEAKRQTVAK
jgi:hypothetical protein